MKPSNDNHKKKSIWSALLFTILVSLSAFLLVIAFCLTIRLWRGQILDSVSTVQATFLIYGLGIGLFGSAVALYAPNYQRRFGTATVIHGFGFLVLSFFARRYLEQRAMELKASACPLIIPGLIVLISFVIFAQGLLSRPPSEKQEEDDSRAELPPPLFPP